MSSGNTALAVDCDARVTFTRMRHGNFTSYRKMRPRDVILQPLAHRTGDSGTVEQDIALVTALETCAYIIFRSPHTVVVHSASVNDCLCKARNDRGNERRQIRQVGLCFACYVGAR